MRRIYWDTMLFVYWIEEHPHYAARVKEIFATMRRRGDTLCTSTLTLGEVLVGARRHESVRMAETVRAFFSSGAVMLLPLNIDTAERYADVRAANRVAPADAIHLASAAEAGVDLFLTNDKALKKLVIPGIQFIAGLDTDVL